MPVVGGVNAYPDRVTRSGMDRTTLAGIVLTVGGLVGYAVGIAGDAGLVPVVEGRAFSVTGVMVGITLLALGSGGEEA